MVVPEPASIGSRRDYFGNEVQFFSLHEAHRSLTVTTQSRVESIALSPPQPAATANWEAIRDGLARDRSAVGLDAYQFVFDSPLVQRAEPFAAYARPSFPPQRPIADAALDLARRINTDFVFDAKATTLTTTLDEVFRQRRGVCQDFAHLQIACLRSLGLAARYISGYLETRPPPGKPRLVGADASHAWLSVFCGEHGWIDFDPTNRTIPTTEHITLAWGRDYGDVCPIRGVFVGGGLHHLHVAVDVEPLDTASA